MWPVGAGWIMFYKTLAVLALAAATVCPQSSASARGPSNPEERARALDYIHSLEQKPIGRDTLQKRMWLSEWIVQVPEIVVHIQYDELNSLDKVNNTYSNQLRIQAIYSQAAYVLEHPDVKNEAALKAAGLAGTLRAYRAIQQFDPTAKYPVLDDLAALEKKGKLQKYVSHHIHSGGCSESEI
jgi:hypothetical protein